MKKILTLMVIILSLLLIYLGSKNYKMYYLSLGDFLANGQSDIRNQDYGYYEYLVSNMKNDLDISVKYTNNNYRSIDLINHIKENKLINVNGKKKTIQNALIKADLITLSIGMNDLFNNVNFNSDFSLKDLYKKFDNVLLDLEDLFKLLRVYSKEQIIFLGFYSNYKDLNSYINNNLRILCSKYNIDFIDISNVELDKNYPTKNGYKYISDEIYKIIIKK